MDVLRKIKSLYERICCSEEEYLMLKERSKRYEDMLSTVSCHYEPIFSTAKDANSNLNQIFFSGKNVVIYADVKEMLEKALDIEIDDKIIIKSKSEESW